MRTYFGFDQFSIEVFSSICGAKNDIGVQVRVNTIGDPKTIFFETGIKTRKQAKLLGLGFLIALKNKFVDALNAVEQTRPLTEYKNYNAALEQYWQCRWDCRTRLAGGQLTNNPQPVKGCPQIGAGKSQQRKEKDDV